MTNDEFLSQYVFMELMEDLPAECGHFFIYKRFAILSKVTK